MQIQEYLYTSKCKGKFMWNGKPVPHNELHIRFSQEQLKRMLSKGFIKLKKKKIEENENGTIE